MVIEGENASLEPHQPSRVTRWWGFNSSLPAQLCWLPSPGLRPALTHSLRGSPHPADVRNIGIASRNIAGVPQHEMWPHSGSGSDTQTREGFRGSIKNIDFIRYVFSINGNENRVFCSEKRWNVKQPSCPACLARLWCGWLSSYTCLELQGRLWAGKVGPAWPPMSLPPSHHPDTPT